MGGENKYARHENRVFRPQAERIRVVDGISRRKPVEIEAAREPDRIFLGELSPFRVSV